MSQSQLLLDISTHALLHLEFKKLEKRLTLVERNNLLVQYLKRIVKSNRYRIVRKSTKHWLLLGRKPGTNLESILLSEQKQLLQTCSTDLHHFIGLMGEIESQLGTKVQYSLARDIDLNARYGKVLVCVVDEDLTASFDEDGQMFNSTQLLFIGNPERKELFSKTIELTGYFQAVVAYEDDNHLRIELLRL